MIRFVPIHAPFIMSSRLEMLEHFLRNPHAKTLQTSFVHGGVDADRNTAMMLAIKAENSAAFELMLETTTDINATNVKGVTALSLAAQKGRLSACAALLNRGALVDLPNHNGSTPLIQASHFGFSETVDPSSATTPA